MSAKRESILLAFGLCAFGAGSRADSSVSVGEAWSPPPTRSESSISARRSYEEGLRLIKEKNYPGAIAALNAAVEQKPDFAEAYAARGTAQVYLRQPSAAVADYNYALQLNPQMASPLYGLAVAHQKMKEPLLAAGYFQHYAESHSPDVEPEMRKQAARLAQNLQPKPECLTANGGVRVCGFHCRRATHGEVACAETAAGGCVTCRNGKVICSETEREDDLASSPRCEEEGQKNIQRAPECRIGADGVQVCGYNCRMGTSGKFYCASTPLGQCAMSSNGTWTCP
jgi:tetratricopeptide (TPR) repeat protein